MDKKKIAYFILGTNGSGKTTYYNKFLSSLGVSYINSDLISYSLQDEGLSRVGAINKSSTIAVRLIGEHVNNGESFLTESTFSSDDRMSTLEIIKELKKQGYLVYGYYIGTDNLSKNNKNVRKRVKNNEGHHVDSEVIEKRYHKGIELLNKNYSLFDSLEIIDNSQNEYIKKIILNNGEARYLDEELGWARELSFVQHSEASLNVFKNVKSIQVQGNTNVVVSLIDGGVIALLDNGVSTLIETFQSKLLKDEYLASDKKSFISLLQGEFEGKLTISDISNVVLDEYSRYKNYTLSNGEEIKINSNGVLCKNEYFSFEEFRDTIKASVDEDSFYEFNKYCVKQDTGGRLINPFNLSVNDINIDDITTALSGINRFAGQTKLLQDDSLGTSDFYTVGQHTMAMYEAIKYAPEKIGLEQMSFSDREGLAKMALIHESFEGITGTDLITPFKYATKKNEYKTAEVEAESVMEKIFGIPLMNSELKRIDKAMAATEGYYLVGRGNVAWNEYGSVLDKEVLKVGMSQHEVKNKLKELYIKEGLVEDLKNYKYEYEKNLDKDLIFGSKLNKYKELLSPLGFDDKTIKTFALQKEKSIKKGVDGVEIILDNDSKIKFSENAVKVVRAKSETEIDINDFLLKQKLNDIIKLDYEDSKSYLDVELVGEMSQKYIGLK